MAQQQVVVCDGVPPMPDNPADVAGVSVRLLGYVRGLHVEHDVHPVLVPLPALSALPHLHRGVGA